MTDITIYDTEAEIIEKVSEKNNITVAEVVEMLCDYLDEMLFDNNLEKVRTDI